MEVSQQTTLPPRGDADVVRVRYLCLLDLLVAGVLHALHLGSELLGLLPQLMDLLHHLLTLLMDPVILPAAWGR